MVVVIGLIWSIEITIPDELLIISLYIEDNLILKRSISVEKHLKEIMQLPWII